MPRAANALPRGRAALFRLVQGSGGLFKRCGFALLRRRHRRLAGMCFAVEHTVIRGYLDMVFRPHRAALQEAADSLTDRQHEGSTAWLLWWQGWDAAPELVRACAESAERNLEGLEVVLLDERGVRERLDLSGPLTERVDAGDLPVTQLSDVIRVGLLRRFGGLWADSTMLFLPDARLPVSPSGLITHRRTSSDNTFVARGRWSTFLLGGPPGFPLWSLLERAFEIYWSEHPRLVDYHLFDYVIDYLYRHDLGSTKRLLDEVPASDGDLHDLGRILLAGGDAAALDRAAAEGPSYSKLSYKAPVPPGWVRALARGGSPTG